MISDLDGLLGSLYFPNVANERTRFASLTMLLSRFDKPNYVVILPTDAVPQFL